MLSAPAHRLAAPRMIHLPGHPITEVRREGESGLSPEGQEVMGTFGEHMPTEGIAVQVEAGGKIFLGESGTPTAFVWIVASSIRRSGFSRFQVLYACITLNRDPFTSNQPDWPANRHNFFDYLYLWRHTSAYMGTEVGLVLS